jgi:hypothetical protein
MEKLGQVAIDLSTGLILYFGDNRTKSRQAEVLLISVKASVCTPFSEAIASSRSGFIVP